MRTMSHSWVLSVASSGGGGTVSVATGGILLIQQNKALILSSGSKYSIFLSAAPLQEGREEGRAGRRERQSSLVWTDCGSWKPVFGGAGGKRRGVIALQFKGTVWDKRDDREGVSCRWWLCDAVVMQCQLHSGGGVPAHHNAVALSLAVAPTQGGR